MKCSNCKEEFFHKDKRQKNCSRECFKASHSRIFKGIPQGLTKDKSVHWKGDKIGYHAIHKWLKTNYGVADKCENKKCNYPRLGFNGKIVSKAKSYEWALKKGKEYKRRRSHFIKLCSSCHRKYDDVGHKSWSKRRKKYATP